MNKILIVGHPLSGYAEVETLLQACGMAGAMPSRREGFTPQQISATLNKAHNVASLQKIDHDRGVEQLVPGPVWHGMALDLMLGNLDQALWGWSDPDAIHWLDYWRDLDPSLHFILVYDQPHSVLTRASEQDARSLSTETLGDSTRNWAAYNAALLSFYHRNPQRCLLVHSQQVRASAASYLRQVRARIDAPWSERLEQLVSNDSAGAATRHVIPALPQSNAQPLHVINNGGADEALLRFMSNALLEDQLHCAALYEELQACANVPLATDDAGNRDAAMALNAWAAMVTQRQCMLEQADLMQRLHSDHAKAQALAEARQRALTDLSQTRETWNKAQASARQENELLHGQLLKAHEELAHRQREIDRLGQREAQSMAQTQAAARQENELLVNQLQQLQEELERQHLENEPLHGQLLKAHEELARRQREIDRLGQRDAQSTAQTQAAARQENELLVSQLQQLQEELERQHLENQRLRQLPPQEKTYLYGAADRIRDELSYRVGAALVQCSKSVGGFIRMPWAARRVLNQYRQELPQRYARTLPPLEAYRDAHEVERLRNHLSYRLGEAYLAQPRTLLGRMRMPWTLLREVRAFRNDRQSDRTA